MVKNTLKLRCCHTGDTICVEKKLIIHRHRNGQISRIGTYVTLKDHYNNSRDVFARSLQYCIGPEIFFDGKGRVESIYVRGNPQSQSKVAHLNQCIWNSPILWAKDFYANGKVKETHGFGPQGKFSPSLAMIAALKKEKLWDAVKQAVATQLGEQPIQSTGQTGKISRRSREK